ANFSAEFKGVAVFATVAEQIEIDPLDPRQLQTFHAGVGGRYSILGVAEIHLEHLYAVVVAFDYQNVFSGDLHWVSLAGAEQMLARAVCRLLNAPPHGKKRGDWIECDNIRAYRRVRVVDYTTDKLTLLLRLRPRPT